MKQYIIFCVFKSNQIKLEAKLMKFKAANVVETKTVRPLYRKGSKQILYILKAIDVIILLHFWTTNNHHHPFRVVFTSSTISEAEIEHTKKQTSRPPPPPHSAQSP